ncbi:MULTISPECIES: type II toxin-antitoxin system Phd/YefM family antitoxin [unclassified Campylobacter]|uniref:type II toxin-antitoxin system Phd/YefM family antitoxin n=1 Tax=Campylobacter TaxID=194 RepID=UPI001472E988|nr:MULTISPECIES: type II toxin-antitoxin system Phd/YefM family antitoxin [unclassified Campylobacter]QKF92213.1 toxin-antitoxin system, antitoxin component, Phd/YefM family [Campylobacter sp. CCUG 57310]
MTTFSKDEIYTATEVVRNFSAVLTKVGSAQIKRAVIVKNNKFEAVLLNMAEYERLCEAVEVLQAIYSSRKKGENGE